MSDQPQSLQEVSERLAQVNEDLAASSARIEELKAPLTREQANHSALDNERERLLQALEVAKRAHFIAQARAALGVEADADPVIIVRDPERRRENAGKWGLPEVWELVAVAADGTGLYKHAPPKVKGYRNRERNMTPSEGWAIRKYLVPEVVWEALREYDAATTVINETSASMDYSTERRMLTERLRRERDAARREKLEGAGLDGWAEVRPVRHSDLVSWQARGSGAFGKGSGAYKPLAPPNGGRWRKLKVEEQQDLPAAVA